MYDLLPLAAYIISIMTATELVWLGSGKMRFSGIRRKIYRMTYDKPVVNKAALQFRNSLEEVKRLLARPEKK